MSDEPVSPPPNKYWLVVIQDDSEQVEGYPDVDAFLLAYGAWRLKRGVLNIICFQGDLISPRLETRLMVNITTDGVKHERELDINVDPIEEYASA